MNGVWMLSATSARKEQKHLDRRLANWKNLDERSSNKTWLSARLSSWNENGLARVSTARNKSRRGVDSIRPRGVQGVRERSIDGENGAREAVGWSANAKGSVNARTYIYISIHVYNTRRMDATFVEKGRDDACTRVSVARRCTLPNITGCITR